jgi:aspartyl/asparaginyl-tRNA synthetase
MAKHKFVGKVHSVKENRAFVLVNDGDYFGASIFPSPAQLAELKTGDVVAVEGNVRQTAGDNGNYMTAISVPKGEHMRIAKKVNGEWIELEAGETAEGYDHDKMPF